MNHSRNQSCPDIFFTVTVLILSPFLFLPISSAPYTVLCKNDMITFQHIFQISFMSDKSAISISFCAVFHFSYFMF